MMSFSRCRPWTNVDQGDATSTAGLLEQHERILRAWQLAILRFAVTLDDSDRLNVLAIAQQMDQFGRKDRESEFRFFQENECRSLPGNPRSRRDAACDLALLSRANRRAPIEASIRSSRWHA